MSKKEAYKSYKSYAIYRKAHKAYAGVCVKIFEASPEEYKASSKIIKEGAEARNEACNEAANIYKREEEIFTKEVDKREEACKKSCRYGEGL